jgi:hypothetical protein
LTRPKRKERGAVISALYILIRSVSSIQSTHKFQ